MPHPLLWAETAQRPTFPGLPGDLDVEVCIVGAGITGISLAWELGREGLRVAVIEAQEVGSGSTGHTSAHLTWMPDRPLHTLAEQVGRSRLGTLVEAQQAAIDAIEQRNLTLALGAEVKRVPGWRYVEDGQVDDLEAELEELDALGIPGVITPQTPLPFHIKRALRIEDQALFHPLKYLYGLTDALPDTVSVYTHTRVVDWHDGAPCEIETDRGFIRARELVLATHTPPGRMLRIQARVAPYLTWLLALRLEKPLEPGLYWDTADPYHYHRPISPDQRDVVLVGGFDHRPGARDADEVVEEFNAWAQRHFPVQEVIRSWCHEVFEPTDGLPYIGRMPGLRHTWLATGFSGTGLTLGTVAARILSHRIQGQEHPWAHAFAPGRVEPLRSAGRFLHENLENALHFFGDRLRPGGDLDPSDLKFGEGRVLQEGAYKLAVYRDNEGDLHAMSPVCTHAGCIVGWNAADRTWDCPCHGGRYDCDGAPLYGPPMQRLRRRPLPKE